MDEQSELISELERVGHFVEKAAYYEQKVDELLIALMLNLDEHAREWGAGV